MPSIKALRGEGRIGKKGGLSQGAPNKRRIRKDQEFGIVNYINGVPVSIQINKAPNLLETSDTPGMPGAEYTTKEPYSWKSNMQKRNNLVNNDDVNKMHYRNELEKKGFQT